MKTWLVSALLALSCTAFAGGGYLGVNITESYDSTSKKGDGVLVTGVVEGSGAEKAGILKNDRILSINGTDIFKTHELISYLNNLEAGEKVALKVLRDNKTQEIEVELGERSISLHRGDPKKWVFYSDQHGPWLGIDYMTLNPELAEFFGVSGGVLVKRVVEDSPAKASGLQAGDVITHLEGQPLEDTKTFLKTLSAKSAGDIVNLVVNRRGDVLDLNATLSKREDMNFDFQEFRGKFFDWDQGSLKPLENLPHHLEMMRPLLHEWDPDTMNALQEELKKLRDELEILKKQRDEN